MTREIKFRFWIKLSSGEIKTEIIELLDFENGWRFSLLDGWNDEAKIISRDLFTNLKDKNGKEIYEEDIFGTDRLVCVVKFIDFAWRLDFVDKTIGDKKFNFNNVLQNGTIQGNIYENKELLK